MAGKILFSYPYYRCRIATNLTAGICQRERFRHRRRPMAALWRVAPTPDLRTTPKR